MKFKVQSHAYRQAGAKFKIMKQSYFLIHGFQYLLLLGIFLMSFLIIFLLPDRTTRSIVALVLLVCYFLWGVLHHLIEHNLQKSTILEYLAIAFLALWILLSVVK